MIIEFTGVPCSGKSDVSHELASLLRKQGHSVSEMQYELTPNGSPKQRLLKKIFACLSYLLCHPKRAFGLYRLLGSVGQWTNCVYLLYLSRKDEICILEQGFLQLVGSLFDNREPNEEEMKRLFDALVPKDNIIQVFVSVSKETVLRRACLREDKPFFMESDSPETALNYAFNVGELLKALWLKERGDGELVSVSNEEDGAQTKAAYAVLEIMKQKELL